MTKSSAELVYHDCEPSLARMRDEVLSGLRANPKSIPSKYFYDERGSLIFEQICELDEYYLTRTELAIMEAHVAEMGSLVGTGCILIEYGSGAGIKTRLLLDELSSPAAYVPIDISGAHLQAASEELFARFPDLDVLPVCADFTESIHLPKSRRPVRRRVVYFPGSTIGNFSSDRATRLMAGMAELVGSGGGLLIGADLKKDRPTLERAYSDSEGVTRQFNLNLLRRLNRELDADFDLDKFEHLARYNETEGRMESYLVSLCSQVVRLGGVSISFAQGESIHTENSYKYDLDQFRLLANAAGFDVQKVWTDAESLFSVQYLTAGG